LNTDLLKGFYLGDHLVEPCDGRVIGREGSAHLPPKAMEVLLCLAGQPGELLTRESLLETVWGAGNGSHEALSHAVSEIRHALGDHHDHATYVQTLPKRGYRLLVDVQPATESESAIEHLSRSQVLIRKTGWFENLKQRGVLETALAYLFVGWLIIQVADVVFQQLVLPRWAGTFVTALVIAGFPIALLLSWFLEYRDGRAIPHELSPKDISRRRFSRTYLAVLGAFAIATIGVYFYDRSVGLPSADVVDNTGITAGVSLPEIRENSIAVLPFMNVDGAERTAIFANGLADDLITRLARIPGLLVSSRGDSFTLAPNSGSSEVRDRLRVAMYVEGSIQIEADTMRIIVQLIDSATGFHVVARSIDRPVDNFFDMRNEITEFTVANVRVALPAAMQQAPIPENEASDLNAYVAYRRGKELYEAPQTIESLDSAMSYYRQALAIDAGYAAANAGLCAAHVARYELSTSDEDIAKAEAACASALDTNPNLYMVHTALGDLYRRTSRNAPAKEAYNEALRINPQDARAMAGMALVFQREQRADDAERLLRRAIEVQPGNWRSINNLGRFLFSVGRFDEAADAYRQVVLLDPKNFQGLTNLGTASILAGDFETGRLAFEESLEVRESDTAYSNLGVVYYYLGEYDNAVAANRKAVELLPQQAVNWLNLADALHHAGNEAEAQEAFRQGAELARSRIAVDPLDFETMPLLAWAQQMLGDKRAARETLDRALALAPDTPYTQYYAALIDVQDGMTDTALDALERAIENGYPPRFLAAEPYLAALRGNRRFEALVAPVDNTEINRRDENE